MSLHPRHAEPVQRLPHRLRGASDDHHRPSLIRDSPPARGRDEPHPERGSQERQPIGGDAGQAVLPGPVRRLTDVGGGGQIYLPQLGPLPSSTEQDVQSLPVVHVRIHLCQRHSVPLSIARPAQLAESLGISPAFLWKIENDKAQPSPTVRGQIVDRLAALTDTSREAVIARLIAAEQVAA
jgi:hypothetical protein